jgi:DNA-binding transcriptional ArsR family regulator
MEPVTKLDQPAQWKAISHPLRLQILNLLTHENLTNEQIAAKMGQASGKLYFHTKKLLDAGLIELAETRQKGPRTEKVYRRAIKDFEIAMVEDGSAPPLAHYIANAIQAYEARWQQNPEFPQFGCHVMYFQTAEKEKEFYDRLTQLMNDFIESAVREGAEDARLVSMAALAHRLS